MNKCIVLLTLFFIAPISFNVVAEQQEKTRVFETKIYNPASFFHEQCGVGESSSYIDVNIEYPQLVNLKNVNYQEAINRHLRYKSRINIIPNMTSVKSNFKLTKHSKEKGYIAFLFESTYLPCGARNSKTLQYSVHINYKKGLNYHLDSFFVDNFKPYLTKLAKQAYKDKFPSGNCATCVYISNDMAFSFSKGSLFLHYSQYSIASGGEGTVDLEIPLIKMKEYILADSTLGNMIKK